MATGEYLAYAIPVGRLAGQLSSIAYELTAPLAPPTFIRVTEVNYFNGHAIHDSTINIALVLLLLLLLSLSVLYTTH